jgi:putative hydrolase of the HAD superfamily
MSQPHPIVIFDLGEVLVTPTHLFRDLAARVEVNVDKFEAAYWTRRLEYDLGLDAVDYWTDILEELAIPVAPSLIEALVRIDTRGWTAVRPDAVELLELLHSARVRLGILSNATSEMATAARRAPWAPCITDWFFSVEVGLAKPNPALYDYVAETVGLPGPSIVYLEDNPRSVITARAAGWNAHLWTSAAGATAFLAGLGLISAT